MLARFWDVGEEAEMETSTQPGILGLSHPALAAADEGRGSGAEARPIGWQEAIARLAAERTRAETCAALVKRLGDAAAKVRGELGYGEAKAEADALIAGLIVALARGAEPASLPGLEERLRQGVAAREAFCAEAVRMVPARPGEKSVIVDLATAALGPLIEAVKALWLGSREADRLTAKTIETQLEAVRWRDFAAVTPSA